MIKTRLSLFYLASYLNIIGFGLLLFPGMTLDIMQSTGAYGDVFPRVAGMLMSGLGITVAGLIRANAIELYPATIAIRVYFLICISVFYVISKDPLFPVMFIIVGIGFMLTASSYLMDRKTQES